MSIRESARRVRRDVKGVHSDIAALLSVGIFEGLEDGRTIFPRRSSSFFMPRSLVCRDWPNSPLTWGTQAFPLDSRSEGVLR